MDLLRMAEEGLDAYEALQIYLKSLLVPLPPSRYEVSSPIVRPVPRVVAVLETGGEGDRPGSNRRISIPAGG